MHHRRRQTSAATITATATAVPRHVLARREVKEYFRHAFDLDERRLAPMMAIIDNTEIEKRHVVLPIERLMERRTVAQTTTEYKEHAVTLAQDVAEQCLVNAGMTACDIDMIITVSCTGFMIPSVDAHLIELLGFRSDVRRMPLTELGCAAGAMALTRASEFVTAYADANVLVVTVEVPSLTFQRGDLSQANLISSVLFGDGAAAAIVTGRDVAGPRILDAATYTFPGSIDAMGFELRDTGFHIVLSKHVPDMIRHEIRALVDCFLERSGVAREAIVAFMLHPGGRKLLCYLEEQLGLCRCDTQCSWRVLGEYGNLSSATILFILNDYLRNRATKAGDYALAAAFGPGFSAELLLLKWV